MADEQRLISPHSHSPVPLHPLLFAPGLSYRQSTPLPALPSNQPAPTTMRFCSLLLLALAVGTVAGKP